mmetsp:Transcript_5394/g.17862  ORF Transcript_5394/g.17862 Transcript_5394/m.17862 type:complete len:358 (+) Transcript_5394:2956-4029(+)
MLKREQCGARGHLGPVAAPTLGEEQADLAAVVRLAVVGCRVGEVGAGRDLTARRGPGGARLPRAHYGELRLAKIPEVVPHARRAVAVRPPRRVRRRVVECDAASHALEAHVGHERLVELVAAHLCHPRVLDQPVQRVCEGEGGVVAVHGVDVELLVVGPGARERRARVAVVVRRPHLHLVVVDLQVAVAGAVARRGGHGAAAPVVPPEDGRVGACGRGEAEEALEDVPSDRRVLDARHGRSLRDGVGAEPEEARPAHARVVRLLDEEGRVVPAREDDDHRRARRAQRFRLLAEVALIVRAASDGDARERDDAQRARPPLEGEHARRAVRVGRGDGGDPLVAKEGVDEVGKAGRLEVV